MSSVQERLQLKRVPLDSWNIREQLCLASAVVQSGDQNWMSVSRALKTVGDPNRPADWYSQKSCAAQYGALLEHVETPKRKKRNSEGAGETPQESILKRLTAERIAEIQKTLAEMNQQHALLKNEIAEIRNPATTEERIKELWSGVEAHNRARERETARRAAWLREREERRARASRNWRPSDIQSPVPTTPPSTPSSPLLTSLLKSNPVVTTPQHISHPATVVDSVSPSAGAPTLSMLLEKSQANVPAQTSPQESKHAAIEHIKSQLVLIEQRLRAGASSPASVLPEPPPALDIDDIEIKEEDVYAFRDVDIEIPPVAAMHKAAANRVPEKPETPKNEDDSVPVLEPVSLPEPVPVDAVNEPTDDGTAEPIVDGPDANVSVKTTEEPPQPEAASPLPQQQPEPEQQPEAEPEPKEPEIAKEPIAAFPEFKFPGPEIKVIHNEDVKEPEGVREEETIKPKTEIVEEDVVAAPPTVEENVTESEPQPEPQTATVTVAETEPLPEPEVEAEPETVSLDPKEIPLPPGEPEISKTPVSEEPIPTPPPPPESEPEVEPKPEPIQVPETEDAEESSQDDDKTLQEIKKEVAVDSTPLQDINDEIIAQDSKKESIDIEPSEATEVIEVKIEDAPETDDDTPMELSREEEKDGKKKRDYSRKKKPESRTCSGSSSAAEASAPSSPSPAPDADRTHRLWKKSVMLVYGRLCAHKYASLFLRPITDDQAPGYSAAVKRPVDLAGIKRGLDSGSIRTTAQFQRDVLLMLTNALMYNSSEHRVYQMAKEMFLEAQNELGMLLAAQAHAGLDAPTPRRRRHATETPRAAKRSHV